MRAKLFPLLAAALVSGGLLIAACGGDDDEKSSAKPAASEAKAGGPTEAGASELRAGLTSLLQEHVYLAGTAIATGVSAGLDSEQFKASAGTLDANSVALSEAIGGVYGDAAGKQFLALWRDHIAFFVDYTKAKAGGDQMAARAAIEKLDGYRAEFGAFIASANPNLSKQAVADELKPHVDSLFATIRAVVAKSPKVYDRLRAAAQHMPMTAAVLSGAIAKQFPDKFSGSTDSGASELRAGLTSLLQEHVYLAGTAISTGVSAGLDSKQFKASAGTLDANSVALSEAIGGVYGDAAGKQFLALWRDHITFFVDYTKAKAADDDEGAEAARKKLDDYRAEFGAFIASANPNLTKEAVAEELVPHVDSVFTTIDAVVAKDTEVYDELRAAAQHMPMTANVLAGAIAKQFPDKFAA